MKKIAMGGLIGCVIVCFSACGRSGPTVPASANANTLNGPQVTGARIEVGSSAAKYYIGASETFTASLKRPDGSKVPLSDGTWASDTPAVATVNDAGLVTIVGQGWANISCTSDGLTGAKQIWGRLDIRGAWSGTYSIQRCELWGDFPDATFCQTHGGSGLPVSLVLTEEGDPSAWDSLHGTITLGGLSGRVVAVPELDGSLEMEVEFKADPYIFNVAIGCGLTHSGPEWRMMLYYYRVPRSSGQAMLFCDVSLSRTGAGQ